MHVLGIKHDVISTRVPSGCTDKSFLVIDDAAQGNWRAGVADTG